jgi:hypothetical protein
MCTAFGTPLAALAVLLPTSCQVDDGCNVSPQQSQAHDLRTPTINQDHTAFSCACTPLCSNGIRLANLKIFVIESTLLDTNLGETILIG